MDEITKLKEVIEQSNNIVFFGGAGVSTASGIPDFRGANGLYKYTPEEIISHSFFKKHPKEFYEFYSTKMVYKNALPNAAHYFVKDLEDEGKLSAVITQNIDGLHQKAGSKNVIELHGSVQKNHCMLCHTFYGLDEMNFEKPICKKCGGIIKPDVVLYEEPLDESVINKAIKAISAADTLIVCGTSLVVYPAAGFINYFKGKNLVLINKTKTSYDRMANLVINDDIISVIEKLKQA